MPAYTIYQLPNSLLVYLISAINLPVLHEYFLNGLKDLNSITFFLQPY
jgi:hypothetical protein